MSHPSVSPLHSFSPLSLRPGVVGVCFVFVMPERLLLVISEILAGGSLVSALSCVASYTQWFGPWWFCRVNCFASCWGPFSSWHISCHHAWIPIAGCNPTSWCSFCWVVFAWFAFVFGFVLGLGFFVCCDCILDCIQVHYQHFCGYRWSTALHTNLNSSFAAIERL